MTDQELLELLQNKTPDELSVAEVELLAQRMRESAEWRAILSDHVEMESYLAGALGRFELSAEMIASRAEADRGRGYSLWPVLGIGVCAVLLIAAAYFVWPQFFGVGGLNPNQIAANEKPGVEGDPANGNIPPDAPPLGDPFAAPAGDPKHVGPSVVTVNPDKPPAPAGPVEPWERETQLGAAPRPWEEITADGFPKRTDSPSLPDARRWFGPQVLRVVDIPWLNAPNSRGVLLEGLFPLKMKWREDAVLRIALNDPQQVKFTFYRGDQGIALCNYVTPRNAWTAYAITRSKLLNETDRFVALLATDQDRSWRTMAGQTQETALDLRFTGKELVLSRGSVILVQAPFEGLPEESSFHGSAKLRAIAMVRTDSPAPASPADQPVVRDIGRPADLEWQLPKDWPRVATFNKLPDGSIELSAKQSKSDSKAFASLPLLSTGPSEIVVEVDKATPGAGIFLGAKGQPLVGVSFARAKPEGGMLLRITSGDKTLLEDDANFVKNFEALAAPHTWLKLVYGSGSLKVWCGSDGVHWARCGDPLGNLPVPFDCWGLTLGTTDVPRSMELKRVQIHEFPRIAALAPAELIARAPLIVGAEERKEAWTNSVATQRPADTDAEVWQRACAVRMIAQTPQNNGVFANYLARWLYEDSLKRPAALDERFALLDELATVADLFADEQAARSFAGLYERTGRLAGLEGDAHPFTRTATGIVNSPIWTKNGAYVPLPESLARSELIELVSSNRAAEALQLCNQMRSLGWGNSNSSLGPLLDWSEATAAQQLGRSDLLSVTRPYRRHPLIEEMSKEGYNVLAEFDAALAAEAFRDAGQVISTVAGKTDFGLMPDPRDKQLSLSLAGAVALAMREHPELKKVMSDQFGPLGNLRVKQAIGAGDAAAVEAVIAQFPGTDAAAQARLWLGDRLLAGGDGAQALSYFRAAFVTAGAVDRDRLSWRMRLAAALVGEDAEHPPAGPLDFGGVRFTPAEFESLVTSIRERKAPGGAGNLSDAYSAACRAAPPPPAGLGLAKRNAIDGEIGIGPTEIPSLVRLTESVDWSARQLSATVANGQLIVNNRFQVAAYDAKTGELKWRSGLEQDAQGGTHDWTLTPMRPLVVGGQVIARQLTKAGPNLGAFKEDGGKRLWATRPNVMMASDPVSVDGELFVVTAALKNVDGPSTGPNIPKDTEWHLQIAAINQTTGEVRWEKPLMKLRDHWSQPVQPKYFLRVCQLAAGSGRLLVVAGGTVAACDLSGNVHWTRHCEWMSPNDDRDFALQHQQPPLVAGDVAFIQQPGVKSVLAVSAETGVLIWRRVVPGVRRIVGRCEERLIVQTDEGLLALSATTGETAWSYTAADLLEGVLCGSPGGICVSRLETQNGQPSKVRRALVWINPTTGKETASQPLEDWRNDRPRLGPMVSAGDRIWAFAADNEADPKRTLYELVPKQ